MSEEFEDIDAANQEIRDLRAALRELQERAEAAEQAASYWRHALASIASDWPEDARKPEKLHESVQAAHAELACEALDDAESAGRRIWRSGNEKPPQGTRAVVAGGTWTDDRDEWPLNDAHELLVPETADFLGGEWVSTREVGTHEYVRYQPRWWMPLSALPPAPEGSE